MVFNYFTFSPNDNFFDARPGSPHPFIGLSPSGSPPTNGGCMRGIFRGISTTTATVRIGTPDTGHTPQIRQQSIQNQIRVGDVVGLRGQGSSSRSNIKVSPSMSRQQGTRTGVMSLSGSQSKKDAPSPAPAMGSSVSLLTREGDNRKQPEEPIRKVMYFSCWGPN